MGSLFDGNSTSESDNAFVEIQSGNQSGDVADVTSEKRLKVDSKVSGFTYSNKLVFEEMTSLTRDTILPATFTTIYNYSGTGKFFGFHANFEDDNKTWIRLSVDGQFMLLGSNGVKLGDLKDNNIFDLLDFGTYTDFSGLAMHDKSVRCVYRTPIEFLTSVTVQARNEDANKKFRAGIVNIIKD
jgi:hypothetical protein